MRLILNLLWLVFGGLISALGWVLTGCLWCITLVGIPVGLQCFKFASISLDPFGKEIVYDDDSAVSFLLNILWIVFGGIEMAAMNAIIGLVLCITIIGIPWGKQYFKIAKLSLMPFGARVERVHVL
jgi:uncharacterized membrane protein YccF (DUF307 family)